MEETNFKPQSEFRNRSSSQPLLTQLMQSNPYNKLIRNQKYKLMKNC